MLECADRVKDMSRFAKSAPRVDEQWDRCYRGDAPLRPNGNQMRNQCRKAPAAAGLRLLRRHRNVPSRRRTRWLDSNRVHLDVSERSKAPSDKFRKGEDAGLQRSHISSEYKVDRFYILALISVKAFWL